MKGKRFFGTILLLVSALACVACASRQQETSAATSESELVSEGADTPCEVSYYAHEGELDARFLSEGDTIAVISPSSIPSQEQVDATVEGLRQWGYVPVLGKHVCEDERSIDDCLEDLTWALENPSVKAIFCVRGGYGASEVTDVLPIDLISSSDKIIIGYSDITVFHSAWIVAKVPSIHACMSSAFSPDFPEACVEAEQQILRGEIPAYTCESNSYCKEGEADGILIGGNLSTFTAVLGTAYDCTQLDQPYILFLEDVGEDLQHIHRYLTVLKHLGVLDRASGIVFGEWTDLSPDLGDYLGVSRGGTFTSISEMISRQIVSDLDMPIAYGFPAEHGDANYPLLMGAEAHLSVSSDKFTLNWDGR